MLRCVDAGKADALVAEADRIAIYGLGPTTYLRAAIEVKNQRQCARQHQNGQRAPGKIVNTPVSAEKHPSPVSAACSQYFTTH